MRKTASALGYAVIAAGLATCLPLPAYAAGDTTGSTSNAGDSSTATAESGPATPALDAPSGGLLARSGIDGGITDLRDHLLAAYGVPEAKTPGPAWRFTPSLKAGVTYTDNAGLSNTGQSGAADAFFDLTPGIIVRHDEQPVEVDLSYRPTAHIYVQSGNYSQVEQNFDGHALATVWPGWVYFDVRGTASQQSVFGSTAASSQQNQGPGNRQTTTTGSISPYIAHGFGDSGVLQAGYGYIISDTGNPSYANTYQPFPGAPPGLYASSTLTTQRGFASFTTGEGLGRVQNRVNLDSNFYSGTITLNNAERITVSDEASYAINRYIAAVGQVGYENLSYPNIGYSYRGPTGSGGATFTPNVTSKLTLQYRYVDGKGGVFAQGSWQVSPRIRVFGGYSEGISSSQQDAQNSLLSADATTTGASANRLVAGPLLDSASSAGADQQINAVKRLDMSASWLLDRDVLTLSLNHEDRAPVGNAMAGQPLALPSVSINASAGWQHDLRENLSLAVAANYNTSQSGFAGGGTLDTVSVSLGLTRVLNATLSASLRYEGRMTLNSSQGFAVATNASDTQNSVSLLVTKQF